jgi:hypothetical protein
MYHFFRKFFKTELTLNPKIHIRSCVYTSIDNKAGKKITRLKLSVKTVKTVGIRTAIVLSSKKNCKLFIAQKYFHSLFHFN